MKAIQGVPAQAMSKAEIDDANARRRLADSTLPAFVCGYTTLLRCRKLPHRTAMHPKILFCEGLATPIVAFIAELGRMCLKEFGPGRLDADKDGFEWQCLGMEDDNGLRVVG